MIKQKRGLNMSYSRVLTAEKTILFARLTNRGRFMILFFMSFVVAGEIDSAIISASRAHNVNPKDLYQVLKVESGPKIFKGVKLNKNGTFDIGPFQINSIHINRKCREYILVKVEDNANCAAKLIKEIERKYSKKEPNWLSRYHSNTPEKRKIYEEKLFLAKDF
jgi:Transglycosylase SLT domain